MLFPYAFIPDHPIYKLQQWIDELFLNVWCTANPTVEYSIDLLPSDLKELTLEIYNDDRIKTDYFYGPIERVYKLFQGFDQTTKDILSKAYRDNNAIEDLCKGSNGCNPYFYSMLSALNQPLKVEIENYCKSLFKSVIHLKSVQKRIGMIDDHYKEFVTINDKRKCPFCGLNSIIGPNRTVRDAYDHYLPKDIYPFNSINFKNLSPMCHECNSSHKMGKDPITHPHTQARRKAFYPYDTCGSYDISIEINFHHTDISNLTEHDISLILNSPTHQEEVDTWKDIFGIEERYKEKCASKTDGWYWYCQATDEYENAKVRLGGQFTQEAWVQMQISAANSNEYSEYSAENFLKAKYLEACMAQHVFGKESSVHLEET
ncbi:MAG: hypothetical protein HZA15_17040 [Nitrospirae bacterium]|nr:hypothetical protein [Nitrospirota bacterium]